MSEKERLNNFCVLPKPQVCLEPLREDLENLKQTSGIASNGQWACFGAGMIISRSTYLLESCFQLVDMRKSVFSEMTGAFQTVQGREITADELQNLSLLRFRKPLKCPAQIFPSTAVCLSP